MKMQKFVVLFLGIALIFTSCQNSKNPTAPKVLDESQMQTAPTQPADDTSDSQIVSPQYPSGTTVIVAIGDSITYGTGASQGYPAKLEAKLRAAGYSAVVLNEGVPGEQSPETDDRFLRTIAGAQIVLLMIGINDIINPVGCSEYACDTIGHIDSMLTKALISEIIPLVSTVTPIRAGSYFESDNWNIQALNSEIYTRAAAHKVVVVDNYTAILSQGGSILYSDSVHFNDQGYDVIAQQWYDAIVGNNLIQLPKK